MDSIYINHTGGAQGSDIEWEIQGRHYGVHSISYSFNGHNQLGQHQQILSNEELSEGAQKAKEVSIILQRPWSQIEKNYYVKSLISRNWFQVKNSTAIYAIGRFADKSNTIVDGGTGWAVQMAITEKTKLIYLFNQDDNMWYTYMSLLDRFVMIGDVPKLSKNFAGIGTRDIKLNGKNAILNVYNNTFNPSSEKSNPTFPQFFESL